MGEVWRGTTPYLQCRQTRPSNSEGRQIRPTCTVWSSGRRCQIRHQTKRRPHLEVVSLSNGCSLTTTMRKMLDQGQSWTKMSPTMTVSCLERGSKMVVRIVRCTGWKRWNVRGISGDNSGLEVRSLLMPSQLDRAVPVGLDIVSGLFTVPLAWHLSH